MVLDSILSTIMIWLIAPGGRVYLHDFMALKMERPQLLRGHLKFRSTDLDESRYLVGKIFSPHKIEITDTAIKLVTEVYAADFSRSSLLHTRYGAGVNINAGQLNSYYLIQALWEGSIEVTNGNHCGGFKPGLGSIVSPTVPMQMRWSPGASTYTVKLSKHALESRLSDMLGEELHSPLVFDPVLDFNSPQGQRWSSAVEFVRQQLTLSTAVSLGQPMAQLLEDTLCLMALEQLPHNYSYKSNKVSAALAPKSVRRARQYIIKNLQNDIFLEDLARETAISTSTLCKHFKRYYGQSPMQYIRARKLEAVHQILKRSYAEVSVTEIALKFGFNHLGRFSQYYREKFGESPSMTLKSH
jgi:AraC-like DNA-binding protein